MQENRRDGEGSNLHEAAFVANAATMISLADIDIESPCDAYVETVCCPHG
jgi:hypothetical protein